MKKINLTITDMSYDGYGVSMKDDKCYLITDALIGENIDATIEDDKKRVCFGTIDKINKESSSRVKPICKYFGKCGGCNMMHMNYKSALSIKAHFIEDTIKKIGHVTPNHVEVKGMDNPFAYRNKIQMPASYFKGKVNLGYFKRKTHNVINIDKCYLQTTNASNILSFIREELESLNISIYNEQTGKGVLRHVILRENEKEEVMIILVSNIAKEEALNYYSSLVNSLTMRFPNIISIIININKKRSNVILGDDAIKAFGKDTLRFNLLGLKYDICYNSFFQVNTRQVEVLYSEVLRLADLKGTENVIDAYCGVGSISLQLAKQAKYVYGIEIVKEAIDNANKNKELNNINNAEFILGKVEDKIDSLLSKDIDLIVFDPPRKGLEKSIIDMLHKTKINRIIYVSCNYSTLARDIDLLRDLYDADYVCGVDMFAQTTEVETIALLKLKNKA